jgi:hypothetical protein
MSIQDWSAFLSQRHAEVTGEKRKVRLPTSRQIHIDGDDELVTMSLSSQAVTANLQTNGAAFEAWALALKVWCGVGSIALDWQIPQVPDATSRRHYERFLYRAHRFASLFPDWFNIIPREQLADAKSLHSGALVLNVAGPAASGGASPPGSEAALEKALLESDVFKATFSLARLDRQFPVGVFEGQVARGNEVFNGGKSAIDLIGIDDERRLWLFELKVGGNLGLGVISELLFYASVLRDARFGHFDFAPQPLGGRAVIGAQDVMACDRIEACFLAPAFHPLFDQGRIVELLNNASDRGQIPVRFRMVKLADVGINIVEAVS